MTTAFVAKLRFPIRDTTCEPVAHGPFSHAETACYLFEGEPCFAQFNQLLIAVQPFSMSSKVSTSRSGSLCRGPLGKCGDPCLHCLADLGAASRICS